MLNHLWQSTAFVGLAWLLALALKCNAARVRYWVWLAASMKFLVPFGLLVAAGSQVSWRAEAPVLSVPMVMEQIGAPFTMAAPSAVAPVRMREDLLPELLLLVWGCGFLAIITKWGYRLTVMNTEARKAHVVEMGLAVPVKSSGVLREPGVFGVLRPILLLPEGIAEVLTPAQLDAVLAHELCHVRRRDNLMTAMHMVVEALFWFHPLVWWIGARLVEERERACDEEVLRSGKDAQTYAEGILKVCEFYLKSPLECVAGVSGTNLSRRIEEIMGHRVVRGLSAGKKMLLVGAGMLAVAGPLAVGLVNAPPIRAQVKPKETAAPEPAPVAVSVLASVRQVEPAGGCFMKPGSSPSGRWSIPCASVKYLIQAAYQLQDYELGHLPGWAVFSHFSVEARFESSGPMDAATAQAGLRQLLAERFGLKAHREQEQLKAFALVASSAGVKFKPHGTEQAPLPAFGGPGRASGTMSMGMLARMLTSGAGRQVFDETGLAGLYDIELAWTPPDYQSGGPLAGAPPPPLPPPPPGSNFDLMGRVPRPVDPDGPALATALREQLGLRLESRTAPVSVLVVDAVHPPSSN